MNWPKQRSSSLALGHGIESIIYSLFLTATLTLLLIQLEQKVCGQPSIWVSSILSGSGSFLQTSHIFDRFELESICMLLYCSSSGSTSDEYIGSLILCFSGPAESVDESFSSGFFYLILTISDLGSNLLLSIKPKFLGSNESEK